MENMRVMKWYFKMYMQLFKLGVQVHLQDLVEALVQNLVEALLLPMFWSRVLLCHKWKKTMSTTILMRMMRFM
ncbi:unnamed protein product [Linum tenue]|uniref:Uncharacterized protein n=1 Tax=Linum tenue TaxID=586396 RepID=A0AAV0I933_9ROSI|nr:unnamed protein product [Linum tenue]CAI0399670.1 unnamed protein product [Linum tenue]